MTPPHHRFDRRYPQLRGTLLIVTYGRSGSTLLQNLLNTIPGAHITGENHNLMETLWQSYRRVRKTHGIWGKEPRDASHPWFGADRILPNRFGERLIDAMVEEVIRPPADVRWMGFKEIRYDAFETDFAEVMNFMARTFKNPQIIFNTRNAEEVAGSSWWAEWPRQDVLDLVGTMDALFARYAAEYPEISYQVSYDELVCEPTRLIPLFDKLGERYDRDRIDAVMQNRLTH